MSNNNNTNKNRNQDNQENVNDMEKRQKNQIIPDIEEMAEQNSVGNSQSNDNDSMKKDAQQGNFAEQEKSGKSGESAYPGQDGYQRHEMDSTKKNK